MYGSGDAVIGINPATDNVPQVIKLVGMLDEIIGRYAIPTQSCVLTHVTNTIAAIERGAPVDLVFQSIAGTQAANASFGIDLALLARRASRPLAAARHAGRQRHVFRDRPGQRAVGNANHGLDQQTCEARAYAVARAFKPLLVNSVVGFMGPGIPVRRQADHPRRPGRPFLRQAARPADGRDVCYTNHAEADQDDMDVLLTMLGAAGCTFVMGVPGADDIMLNYQTTSFHDALYARRVLGLQPAPEFHAWLRDMGIFTGDGQATLGGAVPPPFQHALLQLP
jgi:ethanolamine ammonia-lyase large subunit